MQPIIGQASETQRGLYPKRELVTELMGELRLDLVHHATFSSCHSQASLKSWILSLFDIIPATLSTRKLDLFSPLSLVLG